MKFHGERDNLLVSPDVVNLLAGALAEDERLVLCGTAIDPAAGAVLRELRPGSSVKKIPSSILEEYRHVRWTPTAANGDVAAMPAAAVNPNGSPVASADEAPAESGAGSASISA